MGTAGELARLIAEAADVSDLLGYSPGGATVSPFQFSGNGWYSGERAGALVQWTSAIPERHGSGRGAAFDEIPERIHTHTEIQATHANTHGISIGIGYPSYYARKVNGDYPSVLVEHRAAASASRGIEVVLHLDIFGVP